MRLLRTSSSSDRGLVCPWAGVVAFLALGLATPAVAAPPEVFALVVGHNGGRPGLPTLRYADDDAVRFARLFEGLSAGGDQRRLWLLTRLDDDTRAQLARAEIVVPPHRPPTRRALLDAFTALGRTLATPHPDRERTLYVVYAGHGLRGRVLLEPEEGGEAAITGTELRAALAELARIDPKLHLLLFVDACRAQSLFGERDGEAGPDFSAEVSALEQQAQRLRLGVLTAASAGKPAGEVEALGAGYFSHALASGLAGAADADGDEVISFGELAAFVASNTRRLTGQIPWFDPPAGDLGATAMDLRERLPRLVIPATARGRYLVEARGGPPVFLEAYKDARRRLPLTLPPGRYRLHRSAEGRASIAEADLRAGQSLDADTLAWGASTEARGPATEPDLTFSTPFGAEAVSSLEAGFHAGRAPSASAGGALVLGLAGTAGTSPLGLTGTEMGGALSLRYHQLGGSLFAGLRGVFATSWHRGPEDYRLDRPGLLAEVGGRRAWTPRLTLHALVTGGAAATLRRGPGASSGDPVGPIAGGGLGAAWWLGARWAVLIEGRYLWHWIRIDGGREASGGGLIDVGVTWAP